MHKQGEMHNLYVYRSQEFVNRNKEIERIMQFLKERQRGVIILEGDRGSGKTALLLELFRRLNQMPEYRPFFLGLFPYSAPEFGESSNLWMDAHQGFQAEQILELLKKLAQYWQVEIKETDSVELQKEYLARELSLRSAADVPLLLVDSVYECDESLRVELETNVLMPLLTLERVFILLSGRGKRPIWGRPELQNAEIIPIPPLPQKEDVKEQLIKMHSPRPPGEYEQIADLSGGFPLIVRVIGSCPPEVPLSDSLSQAIDVLLREVLSEEAQSQYDDIRHHVEKMSLLNIPFRIAEIEDYLFPGDPEKTGKTDKLIRLLLQSFILRYEGKGYRLNVSIVHPIRKWLQKEQKSDLDKYESALKQVSQQLQERYPNAATWYSQMLPSVQQTSQLN